MKANCFKKIDPVEIIRRFSKAKLGGDKNGLYDDEAPEWIHSAAEIVAWWCKTTKAVLRNHQMFSLWRKIAPKTGGTIDLVDYLENDRGRIILMIKIEMMAL